MQIDNIIKEIRRIQDLYHMGNTLKTYDMEVWLIDLSYDLLEYKRSVEGYEDDLLDEIRLYSGLYDDRGEQIDYLETKLEWVKSLSAYGFSDWKQGRTQYD